MSTAHQTEFFGAAAHRATAALLLILAALYLVPFVDRGWVPLDEGMVGQSAERVLTGALPHVDYEEPYPGALSYFYALVFRLSGIDSVHLRWTVFGAAVICLPLLYSLQRRYLQPIAAALGTWVAVGWSFPNYFSTLPSWWILLCALVCLWGVIRYIETDRLRFVVVAGLAAGVAVTVKQTGLYLLPPLVMALLVRRVKAESGVPGSRQLQVAVRAALAVAAFGFVILITRSGLGSGEVMYLLVPIAASCATFSLPERFMGGRLQMDWGASFVAVASAAVPTAILLLPHVAAGDVGAFLNGVFVLPQKRLEFTTLPMMPATQMVAAAVAMMWIFWAPKSLSPTELQILRVFRWAVSLALVLLALRTRFAYSFIWEAARGAAALLPVVALWLIGSGRIRDSKDQRILFAVTASLAWISLSQFPFAAPIYFCYVAPLALVAGIVVVQSTPQDRRLGDGPTLAVVLLFALLGLNRNYVWNVGRFHEVHDLSARLDLQRADLKVSRQEANVYGRLVPLVSQHLGARGLMAGPDTPEIYYLTGQFSPSGRLFDFFSAPDSNADERELAAWMNADVIVLFHGKRFSRPLSPALVAKLRQEFPQGEAVPPFEVRWR